MKAYIESAPARAYFSTVSHGETMEILGLSILKELPVPLPPLAEQTEVCREVARRLSVAEQTGKQVDSGLRRAARLRQSLLKRAFEGKLVPQDPDDEPASALLGRIKAERQQDTPLASRSRRRHNAGSRKSHRS